MNFMSINLRFDTQDDGKHQWGNRKEIMTDLIKQFSPSIIGTQEGWKPQIDELHRLIPPLEVIDNHREWIPERMYPCIFVNSEHIEVYDSGDFWLSKTPHTAGSTSFDSAWPRLATWIKAKEKTTDKQFIFVNTHLDHLLDKTRLLQSEVLISEINNIKDNLPIILAGDFNSYPHSDTYSNILNSLDLYDPWDNHNENEEGSFHSFTGNSSDNYRIDWILLQKEIKCNDIKFEKHSSKGIYPSDHFPVKATITF